MALQPLASRRRQSRLYDFRRPDKFSKEHLRTLEVVFGHFARLATTYFVGQLRTTVSINVTAVAQESFSEFLDSVQVPSTVLVASATPLKGKFAAVVDPNLTFSMIDHLFGGAGGNINKGRALTEIEQKVMERVFAGLLDNFGEALRGVVTITTKLEGIESNPLFAQIVSPAEMTATVTMEIGLGQNTGNMRFCLPFVLLEEVLPRLTLYQQLNPGQVEARGDPASWHLEEVPVHLTAILGATHLTLRQLLQLSPGDVVPLDTRLDRDLSLRVGGRLKFRGRPGRVGKTLAFRIIKVEGGDGNGR